MREFEISHAEKFPIELGTAPKRVQKAYFKRVVETLTTKPNIADPPLVKHLSGYKDLWRIRVSDNYRLVYKVNKSAQSITMLMIDHRDKIYDRLGRNEKKEPGIRIIANAEELIEKQPTHNQVIEAKKEYEKTKEKESVKTSDRLPQELYPELLSSWNIPTKFHAELSKLKTDDDLLLADHIPSEIREKVMEALMPRLIEEVIQQPVRVTSSSNDILEVATGERSLEAFLLKLDDEQIQFVDRFDVKNATGPWLLKGGPGSGKSTVALYCIRSLLQNLESQLPLNKQPIRILFTTFTNSLVNASKHLLTFLSVNESIHQIDVINVDELAKSSLPRANRILTATSKPESFLNVALQNCKDDDAGFGFNEEDIDFLGEEIEWVIIGQDLETLEVYRQANRSGRGRGLGVPQREKVWKLYLKFMEELKTGERTTFTERLRTAARHVEPKYDYVFIDEAQDLKPVAVRFCVGLCRNSNNVFLTADSNQSIYGTAMSWTKITSDLSFQGRSTILRKNYRTTTEIWEAVTKFAPTDDVADRDTLDVKTVFKGPSPVFAKYRSNLELGEYLNSYLYGALKEERLTPGNATILCPTGEVMHTVEELLDPKFNAKKMVSKNFDMSHSGVKILTMHAAKGLQFPVVAIVGLENGCLPKPTPGGVDVQEHLAAQKRLLFVACTRAMKRLIVFANMEKPSPFIEPIADDEWEVHELWES